MANLIKFNNLKSLEQAYIYLCSAIIILGTLLFSSWYYFPEKPITIENPEALKVDKEVYHWGDVVTYTLSYCKDNTLPVTLYRSLVDGTIVNFYPVIISPAQGCHTAVKSDLTIPSYVTPGTYHIEGIGIYQVNPVSKFESHWRTVDFKIEK